MKTHLTLLTVLMLFLFMSCDNDSDIITKPIEPTTFKYVYTGKHEIKGFDVFVGPKGDKLEVNNDFASKLWGESSTLGEPQYDSMVIDSEEGILYVNNHEFPNLSHSYTLKLSKDTLKYMSGGIEYWGLFTDASTLVLNRAFYYINYKGRERADENGKLQMIYGHYGYWRYYEKARMNEFFHENARLRTLADMTLKSDTIALLTEYYEFKLTEKE